VGALGHTADVRSEHDVVLGVPVEFLAVEWGRPKLEVSTTAVDVLLVLDGVLDDESLVLVAESREGGRDSVELGILGCLETDVISEFASGGFELSEALLSGGYPAGFPAISEGFFKVDFAEGGAEAQCDNKTGRKLQ
jgi:hypothetical protein